MLGASARSRMPADVLGGLPGKFRQLVFFYLDAFGWKTFELLCDQSSLLRRLMREGVISKLTAQFPSTTAPHVATIHTGLPVGESGFYEWHQYEPKLDRIILPLLYSFAGDVLPNTLQHSGLSPADLCPDRTLYQDMNEDGIGTYVFQSAEYTPSPISDTVFAGTTKVTPFRTFAEACALLVGEMRECSGPGYFFVYQNSGDEMGHKYGPDTAPFLSETKSLLYVLEEGFLKLLGDQGGETLVVISTDHGMTLISPERTFYLNHEVPELQAMLRRNRAGETLAPAGNCRDFFLHVQPARLREARELLENKLKGIAEIRMVENMIDSGWFGPVISDFFRDRVGNLVILPKAGETVWWYEKDRFEVKFRGHHGGLSADEMEIPLMLLNV